MSSGPLASRHLLARSTGCVALLAHLFGCATQPPNSLEVTFTSVPAGAMLVQNGAIVGQMPLTLTYTLTSTNISQGFLRSTALTAQWASGTTATLSPTYNWQAGLSKLTSRTTFNRPAAAPGLDADMAVEARLRQAAEPTPEELEMWRKLGESMGAAAARRR